MKACVTIAETKEEIAVPKLAKFPIVVVIKPSSALDDKSK